MVKFSKPESKSSMPNSVDFGFGLGLQTAFLIKKVSFYCIFGAYNCRRRQFDVG